MQTIKYNKALDAVAIALKLQRGGHSVRARAMLLKAAAETDVDEALEIIDANNDVAFKEDEKLVAAVKGKKPAAKPTKAGDLLASIRAKRKLKANDESEVVVNLDDEAKEEVTEASDVDLLNAEEIDLVDDMIGNELETIANEELNDGAEIVSDEEVVVNEEDESEDEAIASLRARIRARNSKK